MVRLAKFDEARFKSALSEFSSEYKLNYERLLAAFGTVDSRRLLQMSKEMDRWDWRMRGRHVSVRYLIQSGRDLAKGIFESRVIPGSKIKAFETAYKAMQVQLVRDHVLWLARNLKSLQLLLEAPSWPLITEDQADITFRVGPFEVTNQTGQPADALVKILETATKLLSSSKIPKVRQVMYGEVLITNPVARRGTVLAWYHVSKDLVHLFLHKKYTTNYVNSLLHEFGHRYWKKVFTNQLEWKQHHRDVGRGSQFDLRLPDIGEPLKFIRGEPKVVEHKYVHSSLWLMTGQNKGISANSYRKLLEKNQHMESYPTKYAATDPEEHFCEAFALYCMGDLKEPHKSNFEAIING